MYTPSAIESATAAVTSALAMRRNENAKVWRASMRRHRFGMKFADGSRSGHAPANARNRASSLSSSLARIGWMIPLLLPQSQGLPGRELLLFPGPERFQHTLPRPEQPNLKSIFVDLVDLFKFL